MPKIDLFGIVLVTSVGEAPGDTDRDR